MVLHSMYANLLQLKPIKFIWRGSVWWGIFFCIFMQSMLFIVEYNTKLGTIFESNPESEREREKIHLWWQIRKTRKNGAFSINSINSKSITHSYSCENWMLLRHTHSCRYWNNRKYKCMCTCMHTSVSLLPILTAQNERIPEKQQQTNTSFKLSKM